MSIHFHFVRCVASSVLLFLLVWLGVPGAALSRTAFDADSPVLPTSRTTLKHLPDSGLGLPNALPSDRDVYVLATAGGAFLSVNVLARPGVPPKQLAEVLDASLDESRAVRYGKGEGYSGAWARVERGHVGQMAAAFDTPLPDILSRLRMAGFTPHLLLRVPRYAKVVGAAPARYQLRRYNWYAAGDLPAQRLVNVRVHLAWWQVVAFALLVGLPVLNVALVLIGWGSARRLRRRNGTLMAQMETGNRITCLTTLSTVLCLPVLWLFLRSGIGVVSDLWYGSPVALPVFALIIVPLLISGFAAMAQTRINIGPVQSLLDTRPATATPEETAARKRRDRLMSIPGILGWMLLFGRIVVFPSGTARTVSLWVALFLILAGSTVLARAVAGLEARRVDHA
jgi:hypothetical protein